MRHSRCRRAIDCLGVGVDPRTFGRCAFGLTRWYSQAGWIVDGYDVYRLYAGAFTVWSIGAGLGGISAGFEGLVVSRLILGVGESIAYPAYSRMLATYFDEGRRGFANALIDVGTKAGPALGTFGGGMIIQSIGWRPFFLC